MDGQLIKSFLVGLGFGVDDESLSKFNKSIASATLRVSALYGSIKLTTGAVAFGISKIAESFESLGYEYKIIAPAINKALILRQEMLKAYKAANVNLVQTVQSALRLNISLTKTRYAFEALYKSVASRFFDVLAKQSDIFRKKIYDNMPHIQALLERFVKVLFQAFDITTALGERAWSILGRVYEVLKRLDDATNGWSTGILAIAAAWQVLNLGFLNTPLGRLLAGFIALLALWDDLKTFREGGQSLINWGSDLTQTLVALTAVVLGVAAAFKVWGVITAINTVLTTGLTGAFALLSSPIALIAIGIGALIFLVDKLDQKWGLFGGHVAGFFSGIGGKILDFVGGSNVLSNVLNTPTGVPAIAPVGSSVQNNQNSSAVLNQQTTINMHGVADAHSAAGPMSAEQYKTNQDLVRNLRGATTP